MLLPSCSFQNDNFSLPDLPKTLHTQNSFDQRMHLHGRIAGNVELLPHICFLSHSRPSLFLEHLREEGDFSASVSQYDIDESRQHILTMTEEMFNFGTLAVLDLITGRY